MRDGVSQHRGPKGFTAREFSSKVLDQFQVETPLDGDTIVLRAQGAGPERRWQWMVPLQDLPELIQEPREHATGFSGIHATQAHVRGVWCWGSGIWQVLDH